MSEKEQKDLRRAIRALWEQRLDTVDMAKALQLPEHVIEAHLHVALNARRAVVGSLAS